MRFGPPATPRHPQEQQYARLRPLPLGQQELEEDELEEDAFLDLCCCSTSPSNDESALSQPCCSLLGRTCVAMGLFLALLFIYTLLPASSVADRVRPPKTGHFDHTRVEKIVNNLCTEYRKGKVSGNLCKPICQFNNWTLVDFHEGASKKALRININGQDVIFKSTKDNFDEYEQIDLDVDEEELTDKIVELVNAETSMGWPLHYKRHLIKRLWPDFDDKVRTPQLSRADRASLWALLQQDEFITFTILPLSRVTSKVHGSCGHMYAVDTLLPFRMKGFYMGLKAKILVHLMGTLKLFYDFINEPLQWCDVKFENLGLSAQYPKRFVIMDGDMLYTESKLNSILTSTKCSNETDCRYFDCRATCNVTTGFCTERVNDNVDVFCEKLVGRLFGTYWSKSNHYLSACHDTSGNKKKRLDDLRLVWSWSLTDV